MEELRSAVGKLYEEFGSDEITIALSQMLDELIVIKQMEEFEKWKYTNKL